MSDVLIFTNKEKEVIYEYSDAGDNNIANQQGVTITIFYKGGARIIKIVDAGVEKVYKLKVPKKPDDTGSHFLRFSNHTIVVSKEATQYFPVLIDKEM